MNILLRNIDGGGELGVIADAEHVPRPGEEIVLDTSNRETRARWEVRRVVTQTEPGGDRPEGGLMHRATVVIIEVSLLGAPPGEAHGDVDPRVQ
jgi:hypothetical protein